MKGRFIALEGLDGSGLSTQATLLETYVRGKGYPTLLTKEPTNGLLGGIIRAALKEEWKPSNRTLQLLFSADRAYHLDTDIEPSLQRGRVVITDRYLFSTLAYGYASNINYKWLRTINLSFRLPDLGILLDVSPETAMTRISGGRVGMELFEKREELSKVRKAYLNIAREFHLHIISGEGTIEETREKIRKVIDKFLS